MLVVSDLHYERGVRRGVDESAAWRWLLGVVERQAPDLLVGLGDWGEAAGPLEFKVLLGRVRVWSIYGNHDRLEVLASLRNVVGGRREPVLMGDGEIRVAGGLRFGAVNGIVSRRGGVRRGVPRKTVDEFLRVARRLRGRVDVLLMHESPPLPGYDHVEWGEGALAAERVVRMVRPRLCFCGHLHAGEPYTVYRLAGSLCIRVDSSQRWRSYAVIAVEEGSGAVRVELWYDVEMAEVFVVG